MLSTIASPGSELSTMSTPCPRVSARIWSAQASAVRIEHVVGAEQAHEFALFVAARAGEHLGTEVARDLDRRDADAARDAVDQHAFTATQTRQLDQRIPGGEEGGGNRGGFLEAQARRFRGDRVGARHHARGEAGRLETEQPRRRGGAAAHPAADAPHAPGQIHADGRAGEVVLDRFVGEQAHGVHHVAEIEAGGDRARSRPRARRACAALA